MNRQFSPRLPDEGRASIHAHGRMGEMGHGSPNTNQIPAITDIMNDLLFSSGEHKKGYYLNRDREHMLHTRSVDEFDSSTRSVSSRQTQEWLEEAKRMVTTSAKLDSPSRLVGSPRFGITKGRSSVSSLDRRDPLSRSARRNRAMAMEGFSGEILTRTGIHARNGSETNSDPPQPDLSPASDIQKWLSKISNNNSPGSTPPGSPPGPPLPPRQSLHRKSRFQTASDAPASHTAATHYSPSRRNFKPASNSSSGGTANLDPQLTSPAESAHRRTPSSCSLPDGGVLSPPRNLVESAHRRSISSSTCRTDRIVKKDRNAFDRKFEDVGLKDRSVFDGKFEDVGLKDRELNDFLKEQRIKILKLMSGEIDGRAKVVLSGPSNSTSSMVAATCYAWLLENRMRSNKKEGAENENNLEIVVPVMNMRRGKMWKQRQAAWVFHHAGLDATSLLFSNEVELETLMMAKQLSVVEVGEDILKTKGEVGSACTVLTDNYCEDAYDLLQTPIVKKLLLAGILLDTQNLSTSPNLSVTRDAEAVQLLTVAAAPNYPNTLYDQLTQDQRDDDFFEVLSSTYGKPPSEIKWDSGKSTGSRVTEKIPSNGVIAPRDDRKQIDAKDARNKKVSPASGKPTPSPAPAPAKTPTKPNNDASRGRNFFAKLFGFGSK